MRLGVLTGRSHAEPGLRRVLMDRLRAESGLRRMLLARPRAESGLRRVLSGRSLCGVGTVSYADGPSVSYADGPVACRDGSASCADGSAALLRRDCVVCCQIGRMRSRICVVCRDGPVACWRLGKWPCGNRQAGERVARRERGWSLLCGYDQLHFLHCICLHMNRMLCKCVGVCRCRGPGAVMVPGSRGGSSAGSTLAADRGVLDFVTVRYCVACVVSMVVNHILSARVVLSSIVAVVAAVRRNELSQSDGGAR